MKYILPFCLAILFASCGSDGSSNQTATDCNGLTSYPEVVIGNDIWMAKNLDVCTYQNGDPIPEVTNAEQWKHLTTGAFCYLNNDSANGPIYGKIYNWYAVNDSRGLAPDGYHVASHQEWIELENLLETVGLVGGQLKSTTGWAEPNVAAINSRGFTALPGGSRNTDGNFVNINRTEAHWWTSTDSGGENAWTRYINQNSGILFRNALNGKENGRYIRCVKD